MKQNIDLIDSETGFKFRIESAAEVLTKDITIVVPDDDNAVLATSKQVENLRTGLTNGSITVRNAETVGDKQATDFALADLSNVDLTGIGGGTGSVLLYGAYSNTTSVIPTANNFVEFLNSTIDTNTFPSTRKVDNTKFLLKAGSTYNIRGAILTLDSTSGALQLGYKFHSVATDLDVTPQGSFTLYQSYISSMRRFTTDAYVTFTEDVYVKLKVITNSLVSGSNLSLFTLISEYSSTDISLSRFTINGKTFDNNNNVDLEGISTLSGYSLSEVLTEKRWVNGKPIYRKVVSYTIGATAPSADLTIPSGITGADFAWVSEFKVLGPIYVSTESNSYYVSDTVENRIICTKDGASIFINVSNNNATFANYTYYIIMEYTKTNDTSSSPVRLVGTGNGTGGIVSELPAITNSNGKVLRVNQNGQLEWFDNSTENYYTTESLTGKRWVDGKPIYRKVITFTDAVINTTYSTTIASNVENVIDYYALLLTTAGIKRKTSDILADATVTYYNIYVQADMTFAHKAFDSTFVGTNHTFIVEYTKSTDTSSSPVSL